MVSVLVARFLHSKGLPPAVHIWNEMNEISVFESAENATARDLHHIDGIEERETCDVYGHLMFQQLFEAY
jgi:alpha-glucosidase (family GH31 glycosyl hydrolase)